MHSLFFLGVVALSFSNYPFGSASTVAKPGELSNGLDAKDAKSFLLTQHLYRCDDYRKFWVDANKTWTRVYFRLGQGFPKGVFATLSFVSTEQAEIVRWKDGSPTGVIGVIQKADPVRINIFGKVSDCEPVLDCKKALENCAKENYDRWSRCEQYCYEYERFPPERYRICLQRCDSQQDSDWLACRRHFACAFHEPE